MPVRDASPSPPPAPPALTRGRAAAAWAGLATAVGLLFFAAVHLDNLSRAEDTPWIVPFLEEMTGAYAAGVLVPAVVALCRRLPLAAGARLRRLPAYAAALLAFSAAHTTLMWASRSVLFPLAGLGPYDYGQMGYRYAMELQKDAVAFALVVAFTHLFLRYRAARDREVRVAALEARLAQAELQALRSQIQPHFLFNTLHTISSVMYEDVARADALIGRLSELLRLAMRSGGAAEVPLAEEMAFLRLYLEIMQARFGPRLTVSLDVDPAASQALVPHLLLQPLVENSIRHGVEAREGAGRIEVRARRDAETLRLAVRDDGPGLAGARAETRGTGIGLANTAERLAGLYGDRHRLAMDDAEGGGLLVSVDIPFRTAAEAAP
jgi:two-component system LytT family sensor kinase